MATEDTDSNSAHHHAVRTLNEVSQQLDELIAYMEQRGLPPGQLFIETDDPRHPQKAAHSNVMKYWGKLNKPGYINVTESLWKHPLTDAKGNEIEVVVPKDDEVEMTVTEATGIDSFTPPLPTIETTTETVSLEQLGYKWRQRFITVRAVIDSPYRNEDSRTRSVPLWMPPRLIIAATSQLESCKEKLGADLKVSYPVETDPDPI